jgi:hypothetical protein
MGKFGGFKYGGRIGKGDWGSVIKSLVFVIFMQAMFGAKPSNMYDNTARKYYFYERYDDPENFFKFKPDKAGEEIDVVFDSPLNQNGVFHTELDKEAPDRR